MRLPDADPISGGNRAVFAICTAFARIKTEEAEGSPERPGRLNRCVDDSPGVGADTCP